MGCPDRAASYPANSWEYVNARRDRGYTYYVPVTEEMLKEPIDVYVISYNKEHSEPQPVVWLSRDPEAANGVLLILE